MNCRLHEIDYDGSNGWPTWAYVCLGVAIAVVILICIHLYRKYGQKLRQTCSAIRNQCGVRILGITESHLKSASSTNERQNKSTDRETEPSAPTNESFIKKLYPMLFEETTPLQANELRNCTMVKDKTYVGSQGIETCKY